jgi:hypothetical protein
LVEPRDLVELSRGTPDASDCGGRSATARRAVRVVGRLRPTRLPTPARWPSACGLALGRAGREQPPPDAPGQPLNACSNASSWTRPYSRRSVASSGAAWRPEPGCTPGAEPFQRALRRVGEPLADRVERPCPACTPPARDAHPAGRVGPAPWPAPAVGTPPCSVPPSDTRATARQAGQPPARSAMMSNASVNLRDTRSQARSAGGLSNCQDLWMRDLDYAALAAATASA